MKRVWQPGNTCCMQGPEPCLCMVRNTGPMQKLAINLHVIFLRFERWFDKRLGWFFTNGMKGVPNRGVDVGPARTGGSAPTA